LCVCLYIHTTYIGVHVYELAFSIVQINSELSASILILSQNGVDHIVQVQLCLLYLIDNIR